MQKKEKKVRSKNTKINNTIVALKMILSLNSMKQKTQLTINKTKQLTCSVINILCVPPSQTLSASSPTASSTSCSTNPPPTTHLLY